MSRPWRSAGRSENGKVRLRNEDAFLDCPERGLWAVADGMGGHQRGDLASRMVVDSLRSLPADGCFAQRLKRLRECLHWVNRRLSQELTLPEHQQGTTVGTTVVAMLLEEDRMACVWAGDSRCYLWRRQRLYQLSRDHSLLEHLVTQQRMRPQEAASHPRAHALTKAVGAHERLSLDILELHTEPGDVLLLCSDGLYEDLSCEAVSRSLGLTSPEAAVAHLFECALRGPARDNLTAVVIRL
ncbi:PP2C family serine/threonine-protein phosphatase [Pseudomonas sp. 148P]|uniref:PP2C family serine/threonine-protein phosphatase n=1 Tax=Pseudomonas ulcerans TaxID=3115852 RepID=A0ABU7HUJ2_9PSED|nr:MULTISPECIES: PP2C family serine/threonine-protein phosphatase [unclassified Pseudomonas]MEE1924032.1 PP2C family serine/threonine-protein phosphatase [Pseudomonas sp. 147P]MEE1935205.1 PP2C family serine/threonine-protein phosphatase [Pseudomonas sp. 148P]